MEYQRNKWGTDDRFTGPDGQNFTKHDGMKMTSNSQIFEYDESLYKEVLKCHPLDDYASVSFSSQPDKIDLGLD